MASTQTNLEDMYARLSLEEEEEGGILVGEEEIIQQKQVYILVGKLLTDRNINFQALQNVLAAL